MLKDLYRRLVQQGLRMVCLLTKVDLVDPTVTQSVTNLQYSQDIHLLRHLVSRDTGMPLNQVRSRLCAGSGRHRFICSH